MFYIGIEKTAHSGTSIKEHTWVNYKQNNSLTFEDFYANDTTEEMETCAVMWGEKSFQWADVGCSKKYSAICEINIYS